MRSLALVVLVAVTGSTALASPKHHAKPHKKAKHHEEAAPADDDDAPKPIVGKHAKKKKARVEDDTEVAFASPAITEETIDARDDEPIDAPVEVHARIPAKHGDWHFAIGPDIWASSVDAKVSVGGTTVSQGVDFFDMSKHARFGLPLVGEARFGKLSFAADFMYGVVDIDGAKDVGPLMASLQGSAGSLQLDGFAGYRFLGDTDSVFSAEARGGIRYQRTAVAGTLQVDGSNVVSAGEIDAGADLLAGGRVWIRPFRTLYATANVDFGLFGSSSRTWSASADASWQVTSHFLVSIGYRTLTMNRSYMEMVMHGPRAAVQVTF